MNANLTSYVVEKRAHGVPWDHIANMAGCCADDLGAYRVAEARGLLVAPPSPPAIEPLKAEPLLPKPIRPAPASTRRRRGPGGLLTAVLFAVGDGYSTSLTIAALLETSIDNVNNALGRLDAAGHVARASDAYTFPVVWMATEEGMTWLCCQLAEGYD